MPVFEGDDKNNRLIIGGSTDDTVLGHGGDDYISAYPGDDYVDGGDGNDTIRLERGNDTALGGAGNDEITGYHGDDSLLGGAGEDTILGQTGNDYIDGGEGADWLEGGAGFDTIRAGHGDTIHHFNQAIGQDLTDGDHSNNDVLLLGEHYNYPSLRILNAARVAKGLAPYADPVEWMTADIGDDGILNDISTTNGFADDVHINIEFAGRTELSTENTDVVCFGDDALIQMADGSSRAAGDLAVGDEVMTRDAGAQPIRWVGKRQLGASELNDRPNLRPIRIHANALAENVPERDLIVSPQHRMLVRSKIAKRMFGAHEVLVAAKQLLEVDGIEIAADMAEVTYVHILCDDHHVVTANGAEAETLYTGEEAMKAMGPAARREIYAIFPELRDNPPRPAARHLSSGRMARALAKRHVKNSRCLLEEV
ncbi:Hint domain-containing protein [Paracoccus xiamenensis]|uniref:Hint domain-containing protein n=1 Tax=Paracoccus xiamenensis TaxID=2714901 RepID=UPI00140B1545|nr:Hint domain-containing protein [Paracoccus xiamenensis]NHF73124.1 hypothetical protein [Paracoccus xiamenensis]